MRGRLVVDVTRAEVKPAEKPAKAPKAPKAPVPQDADDDEVDRTVPLGQMPSKAKAQEDPERTQKLPPYESEGERTQKLKPLRQDATFTLLKGFVAGSHASPETILGTQAQHNDGMKPPGKVLDY